jgi:hypothetical protein
MSISFPELISLLALLVTLTGVFSTILFNLWRKVIYNSERLSEFKLVVAEKYAANHRINDMEQKILLSEERLHSSLENLSSRIDRLLERMER